MQMLKKLISSNFLRHNATLFFGSVAVGVLNYAYYPVLGRLLKPADFGEVQVLVSLFLQLTIFLTVLSLVAINIVANYRDKPKRNGLLFELEKLALLISLIFLIVTAVSSNWLQDFLHFGSNWPFIILALSLVVSVPFTFRSAFLRGKQRFVAASIAQLLGSAGKIIASVLLVLIGLGTSGAIAGVVIAQAIAFGFAAWRAKQLGLYMPSELKYHKLPKLKALKPELKFSFFVLLGSLAVMLLFSVDVVIVKHFFDAHTAGLYAGVATVARIIFFLTASVAQVLLPAVRLDAAAHQNRKLLIKSLTLLCIISLPLSLILMIFPQTVVTTLMGHQYAELANLLPFLVVVNFTISIINLLVSYFLALRRVMVAIIAIIGFAVSCGLMIFNHASPQSILTSLLLGSVATLCLIATWITRGYLKWRKNDETTATLDSGPGS